MAAHRPPLAGSHVYSVPATVAIGASLVLFVAFPRLPIVPFVFEFECLRRHLPGNAFAPAFAKA
jgi:hypothetical protein